MNERKLTTKSWISFRVKPAEYELIHKHFSTTTHRKLSSYARNVLMGKPVVVKYRNQSADDFLKEMLELKKELNGFGNNFNQAVKKLHTLNHVDEIISWTRQNETLNFRYIQCCEMILIRINQIHQLWLPE